jgi:undecaprenyl diphosphate synthase
VNPREGVDWAASSPSPTPQRSGVPRHVAIIMDGNGRWAQRRGLPRLAGHRAGAEALERVVRAAPEMGIAYLTVYAFSTENWRRPAPEVLGIMHLLAEFLRHKSGELRDNGVRLEALGDVEGLPDFVQAELRRALRVTQSASRLVLVLAVNYGGRWEVVETARRLAKMAAEGKIRPEDIDESLFARTMPSAAYPPPDLIVRPGGEYRLSNFLLWEAAYSEIVVTDTLWPDFGPEALERAVAEYARRERRFGGLGRA